MCVCVGIKALIGDSLTPLVSLAVFVLFFQIDESIEREIPDQILIKPSIWTGEGFSAVLKASYQSSEDLF